jgi:hypothetical protein|tara:strand:+ start:182 stop:547 length:366 start_codon:yes stop_codon:yes gene_type:complete
MPSDDTLESLKGKSSCTVCGCIETEGSIRCQECGTFHSGIHLEEREAPPPNAAPEREIIDPSLYSLSDNHAIPEENFEESEEISAWDGGSTDFSMSDEEELPVSKIDPDELELPMPETLSE